MSHRVQPPGSAPPLTLEIWLRVLAQARVVYAAWPET
jgi:hypothetical protein